MSARSTAMTGLRSIAGIGLMAAVSLTLSGCSGGTAEGGAFEGSAFEGSSFQPTSAQASLFELLAAGPESVPHEGVRRVEVYHPDDFGVLQPLIYREQVAVDAEGSFSIVPLSVDTPVLPDEQTFLLLQEARGGYFFKYRDFRLRDLDLLVSNYQLLAIASEPQLIAGRPSELLAFSHASGQGPDFEIWADVETGLALSIEAFDGDGQLIQRTVYESYTDGDPASFVPYRPKHDLIEADLANPDAGALGVPLVEATLLPDGFQLESLASIADPSGVRWSLATYTDGIEVVFLLGRNANALPAPIQAGSQSVAGSVFGSLEGGPGDEQLDRLQGYEAGRILILDGQYGDQLRIAVGAQPADVLQAFLESSLN